MSAATLAKIFLVLFPPSASAATLTKNLSLNFSEISLMICWLTLVPLALSTIAVLPHPTVFPACVVTFVFNNLFYTYYTFLKKSYNVWASVFWFPNFNLYLFSISLWILSKKLIISDFLFLFKYWFKVNPKLLHLLLL